MANRDTKKVQTSNLLLELKMYPQLHEGSAIFLI